MHVHCIFISCIYRSVFQRESPDDHLLIIQCDSGHQHADLIACARYRVLDEMARESHPKKITHTVFIIGLPRKSGGTMFVSFQGGKWESYHMDSLIPPKDSFFTIEKALDMSIHDILLECYNNDKELFQSKVQSCISPTSLLRFSNVPTESTLQRYDILSQLVNSSENGNINEADSSHQLTCEFLIVAIRMFSMFSVLCLRIHTGQYDFYGALHLHIFKILKAKRNADLQLHKKEWAISQAMKCQDLHKNGSFKNLLSYTVDQKIVMALDIFLNTVDQYCNLHLLKSENFVISNLWFKIFEDGDLFLNVTSELENVTTGNKNIGLTTFKCQFPFFWLIVNSIENQLKIHPGQSEYSLNQ